MPEGNFLSSHLLQNYTINSLLSALSISEKEQNFFLTSRPFEEIICILFVGIKAEI